MSTVSQKKWIEKLNFFKQTGVFDDDPNDGQKVEELFLALSRSGIPKIPYSVVWNGDDQYYCIRWDAFFVILEPSGKGEIAAQGEIDNYSSVNFLNIEEASELIRTFLFC